MNRVILLGFRYCGKSTIGRQLAIMNGLAFVDVDAEMCFAVVGTKSGHIIIDNPKVVNKSFPSFWQELEKCYK